AVVTAALRIVGRDGIAGSESDRTRNAAGRGPRERAMPAVPRMGRWAAFEIGVAGYDESRLPPDSVAVCRLWAAAVDDAAVSEDAEDRVSRESSGDAAGMGGVGDRGVMRLDRRCVHS